jgi:hypothetical protein
MALLVTLAMLDGAFSALVLCAMILPQFSLQTVH